MAFPTDLTNAVDGVTELLAAHLNNLEAKVGVDGSAVVTSLDYLLKNASSLEPGHKHHKVWDQGGTLEALVADHNAVIGIGTSSPNITGNTGVKLTAIFDGLNPGEMELGSTRTNVGGVEVGRLNFISTTQDPGYRDVAALYVNLHGATSGKRGGKLTLATRADNGNLTDRIIIDNRGNITGKSGSSAASCPADSAHLWVADINGAAGQAGWHLMNEIDLKCIVAPVYIKTDTGDPASHHEALICINTADKTIKIYADGGWRQLASW
ncbi:MAG: hypothetical protein ACLFUU_01740 [Desulfobacteraceae bacterium]